ncbi:hypothetical protein B0H19DRAFT_1080966 [Mycena capillaripes]|nr:hypothetical protein B0H19DRAFT_1080966 [Mycena capillaripes]
MNAVLARWKRELKQVDLSDSTRHDYVLRIHMANGDRLGSHPETVHCQRRDVSGCVSGQSLGAAYGMNSGAIDMIHVNAASSYLMHPSSQSGYDFLNEDDYFLAHVMAKVGGVQGSVTVLFRLNILGIIYEPLHTSSLRRMSGVRQMIFPPVTTTTAGKISRV